jgi:hypothetical protein
LKRKKLYVYFLILLQELKQFFQRAVAWRQRKKERLQQSRSMVEDEAYFQFCEGDASATNGSFSDPGIAPLKASPSFSQSFKGTELVIASLPKVLTTKHTKAKKETQLEAATQYTSNTNFCLSLSFHRQCKHRSLSYF